MDGRTVRALLLLACTLGYLVLGATVFNALEANADAQQRASIELNRTRMMQKYGFTDEDYRRLTDVVLEGRWHKAGRQWRFAGSFYFATLVITTLGYGHSTPRTAWGKAFCMLYAMAGIPLNLVMFQSIGERLNTFISACIKKLCQWLRGGNDVHVSRSALILVSSSIGTLIIAIGTYVFHKHEGWTPFEAYYYCFITFSTIGFGDYVPLQQNQDLQDSLGYVVFTLTFILFGLSIFSACVNLLVLRFMAANKDRPAAPASMQPHCSSGAAALGSSSSVHHSPQPLTSPLLNNNLHVHRNRSAQFAVQNANATHGGSTSTLQVSFKIRRGPVSRVGHLVDSGTAN